jgi:hypothetical protein
MKSFKTYTLGVIPAEAGIQAWIPDLKLAVRDDKIRN